MRPPQDTLPDVPDLVKGREEGGFRDELTAPAETRTVNLGREAPWLATPEPPPRETRPRDPLFVPVVVFVSLLALVIIYMLASEPKRRSMRPSVGTSSPERLSQGGGFQMTTSTSLRKHCVFRQDGPTWRSPTIPIPG